MKNIAIIFAVILTVPGISQTSWTLSNAGLPNYSVFYCDFAVAPGGQIYVVAPAQTWNSYEPRLYWSNTGGSTWNGLNISTCDVIVPRSILFVGTKMLMCGQNSSGKNYVYASTDYGVNWSLSSAGMGSYYTSLDELVLGPNGHIYAAGTKTIPPYGATNAVILESGDNGVAWSELPSTGISNTANVFSLFFDKNGKMYLSGGSSILPNRLYTSTNLGYTWTMSNSGIPSTYYVKDFATSNGNEVYAACTFDDGSSPLELRMMKSTNSGASWTSAGTMSGLTNVYGALAMINVNGTLLMADWGSSSSYYVHQSKLPYALPTVSTSPVTGITKDKAVCGGSLTLDGGDATVKRGICWNLAPSPSVNDLTVSAGTGTGTFTATMTGLSPSSKYYVRAFAVNGAGVSYGAEKTFTTAALPDETGIATVHLEETNALYPVPASDFIFVRETSFGASSLFTVIDMSGKVVLTTTIDKDKNSIDIRKLPGGIYFLQGENGLRARFVKD